MENSKTRGIDFIDSQHCGLVLLRITVILLDLFMSILHPFEECYEVEGNVIFSIISINGGHALPDCIVQLTSQYPKVAYKICTLFHAILLKSVVLLLYKKLGTFDSPRPSKYNVQNVIKYLKFHISALVELLRFVRSFYKKKSSVLKLDNKNININYYFYH